MKSHNKFLAFSLSALLVAPGILQEVSAAEETGKVEDDIETVATEEKSYTVRYELRDKDGNLVELLQTEDGWTDWKAMETSSIATADVFSENIS